MTSIQKKIQRLSHWSKILCIFGVVVSFYALYVETKKENEPTYEAMCDINEAISCTKALNSEFGRGFGILNRFIPSDSSLNLPNSIFGIMFYTVHFILEWQNSVNSTRLQMAFSVIANFGSIYLAYILIYKVKTFCAICVVTYFINAFMLYCNYSKYKLFTAGQNIRKKVN